jgi:DnaJ family protein B protein 4
MTLTAHPFLSTGDDLGGKPQDIVFRVRTKSHPTYRREGDDIIVHVAIDLETALCGGKIDVRTLDDRVLRVPLKDVVNPSNSYERVVSGEGMPISRRPGTKGNLRIRFTIKFPIKQLDESKRQVLQQALAGAY